MISVNYINQTRSNSPFLDEFSLYEGSINKICEEVESLFYNYNTQYIALKTEAEIMGEDDKLQAFLMEAKDEEKENNVFAKIGRKVEALVKATINMFKTVIQKIKEIAFSNKSDVAKIEKLVKEHPEMKDTIIGAFEAGDLDVRDIKSFQELDKSFNEIMRMSARNENPKSLKAKWAKAVDKFKNADKSAIVSVASAAVTVGGAVTIVYNVRKRIADSAVAMDHARKMYDESVTQAFENAMRAGEDVSGVRELQYHVIKEYSQCAAASMKEHRTIIDKLDLGVRKFLDKVENKLAGGRSQANADEIVRRAVHKSLDEKKAKDLENKTLKARAKTAKYQAKVEKNRASNIDKDNEMLDLRLGDARNNANNRYTRNEILDLELRNARRNDKLGEEKIKNLPVSTRELRARMINAEFKAKANAANMYNPGKRVSQKKLEKLRKKQGQNKP